jgi:dolichol-phosphate mannosyltransferase
MLVSVIIPCFNEEEVLLATYAELTRVLEPFDYELVFVDDGSRDATRTILDSFAIRNPWVKAVHLSRNFGHQSAVGAGIDYCSGDVAVIIDADLQDPPALIPEMLRLHDEGEFNVVYGVRRTRKGDGFFKIWTARLFYRFLNRLADQPLPRDAGDFRLIDRKVMEAFKKLPEKNKYVRGLIAWLGFRQTPLEYDRLPRVAGKTKYPLGKMLQLAKNALFGFSKKPLKMATNLGLAGLAVGFLLILWVLLGWWFHVPGLVRGWSSLLAAVVFFSGVQLLCVGLIGEYLGQVFDEVKNRPNYVVDRIVSFREPGKRPPNT